MKRTLKLKNCRTENVFFVVCDIPEGMSSQAWVDQQGGYGAYQVLETEVRLTAEPEKPSLTTALHGLKLTGRVVKFGDGQRTTFVYQPVAAADPSAQRDVDAQKRVVFVHGKTPFDPFGPEFETVYHEACDPEGETTVGSSSINNITRPEWVEGPLSRSFKPPFER